MACNKISTHDTIEEKPHLRRQRRLTFSYGELKDIEEKARERTLTATSPRAAHSVVEFQNCLMDESRRELFRTFLRKEFSEENILFWIMVEQFRKLTKRNEQLEMVKEIYDTFLAPEAIQEINTPASVKNPLVKAITKIFLDSNAPIPTHLFEECQMHVFEIMRRDSFFRFCLQNPQS